MAREVLGHIDCPFCGTKSGMRITNDRNGEPFGYCEATCAGQMRIGGNPRRVSAFKALHALESKEKPEPAAAEPAPPPASAPIKTKAKAAAHTAPAPAPEPAPAKPRNPFDDALAFLGGRA